MEAAVARANREVYNAKTPEEYDSNESIFNPRQRAHIRAVLEEVRQRCAGGVFLDVGCGTGNLLLIAREVFPRAYGLDQADRLLSELALRRGIGGLAAAASHGLPFRDQSIDAVGMYALLHHLYDPLPTLAEAFRVLRPGDMLYTDHDPNHFLGRFYRVWYRLRHRAHPGFGTRREELAEYHHTHTSGLNPLALGQALRAMGFRTVEVRFRHSLNPSLGMPLRAASACLRAASRLLPLRSFHTHFMLLAQK